MLKIKELREKRANLNEQAKVLLQKADDEKRDMTAEEEQQFDKLHDEMNSLKGQIDRLERQEAADRDLATSQGTAAGSRALDGAGTGDNDADEPKPEEQRTAAWRGWLTRGMNGLGAEERQAMQQMQAELPAEARAMAAGLDTAGGYTCPDDFRAQIETAMKAYSGVRQLRTQVLSTASGNDIPWPTSDDTSNEGELLGENTAASEEDITFGAKNLRAYMFSSKMVRVSFQFLQDTGIANIEAWLAARLAERIGRITGRLFITGTGNNQPEGLAEGATEGKQGASQTLIKYDDIVDLVHSVDPAYRLQAQFLLGDGTLKNIKKLKDGEGRPLWVPGVAVREPDSIMGYGYAVDQAIPTPATTTISAYFGDFSKFLVRDVTSMQLLRLTERYAEYLQVAFLLFSRHDSMVLDAGTGPIKYFKQA